ncbi:hypothetical protein H2200_010774 [Cladophialophora chaetospira]|uniref:Uncharacterized protein n=1 Tax=Cladophialophora chaetospira TaxID=386627 RepID=A0AA38X0T4_9EURO|nr:hypothetical protein H2200_010774 [Cladophialophora chaetospira]
MDDSLLDAPNDTPATAPSAPGQSIPVWLYRRYLYLLDGDSAPDSGLVMFNIRNDLSLQTGIRIPPELVRAIATTYRTMNPYIRNRIFNFTEAQMRPAEGEFQIQPVPSIRRQDAAQPSLAAPTLTNEPRATSEPKALEAAQDRERLGREALAEWLSEDASYHMNVNAQVLGASSLAVDLELTRQTGSMNDTNPPRTRSRTHVATRQPQMDNGTPPTQQYFTGNYISDPLTYGPVPRQPVSYIRGRLPEQHGNDNVEPLGVNHDANAARRQRYPQQSVSLGLERPAPPSTAMERGTQVRLRGLLRLMNAADDFGTALEGEHVQPTDSYLSGVEQQPLLRDERNLINHATHDELQKRPLFQRPLQHPSPTRPNRPQKDWGFRGQDPNAHYASGPDGMQSVNDPMRTFRPNPNQAPPPSRTFEEVEAAALRVQQRPAAGGRAPGKPASVANARPGRTQPRGRTPTAAPPRTPRTTKPVPASDRVTRGKRKRDEAQAAAKELQKDGVQSDEHPPENKKPRLTLKINATAGRITTGAGAQAQDARGASVQKKAQPTKKAKTTAGTRANTRSPTQAQAIPKQPTPSTPRRLILRMPNPPTETKATGKTRKRGREDEDKNQEDRNGNSKEKDDGKKNGQAKKRRTRK